MYGLFLILSFSSGVNPVAVVWMLSFVLFKISDTFFDSPGSGVVPAWFIGVPFQIVWSGLCVNSKYVPAPLASLPPCDSLLPIASNHAL